MIGAESISISDVPAWPFQVGCVFLFLLVVLVWLRMIRKCRQVQFSRQQLERESSRSNRSETLFKTHETEYQSLLGSVPLGVAVLDENFIYRRCNELMGSIFGMKATSLHGQHVFETFAGSNQDVDFYPGSWCQTTRRASQAVLDMTRSDGKRLVANLYVTPLFEGKDKGDIVGYLQVVEDITARLESQERLAIANRSASAMGRQFRSMLLNCEEPTLLRGATVATTALGEGGSDFVEFIRYDETHLDCLVGTAGQQKGALLLAACVKSAWSRSICNTLLTTRVTGWPTPVELMSKIQHVLRRRPLAGSVVRVSHLRLDLEARRLIRSDMGHNGALLYRVAEGVSTRLETPNGPLPNEELAEQVGHDIQSGDVLLIGSPGLMDLKNAAGETLGVMRLGELLETLANLPPRELLAEIRCALEEFADGTIPCGAMLTAVAFTDEDGRCAKLSRQCRVHADMSNLPELRQAVQELCAGAPAVSHEIEMRLELAVSELASAIFAEIDDVETVELQLIRYEDSVVAEILYTGPWPETDKTVPEMTDDDAQKFGLLIVRNCVDEIEFIKTSNERSLVRIMKRV